MTQASPASPLVEDETHRINEIHAINGILESVLAAQPPADLPMCAMLNKTAECVPAIMSDQSTLRMGCQSPNQTERYLTHPRFCQGLVWSPTDLLFSPTVHSTEYADPVPFAPTYLTNSDAAHTVAAHPELFKIVTPINVDRFQALLVNHPNQPFVLSVCQALREGFWPWVDASDESYPSINDNSMRTCAKTKDQERFIEEQLKEEIRLG
ncbi:hypothetical protein BDR03DRAFT_1005804 [Suillus americanus]|nr:hypothetical protein BDR03DRAFT_1005804 [Suillus americanus]